MITAAQIKKVCPSAKPALVNAIIDNWQAAVDAGIEQNYLRTAHFIANIAVETGGLKSVEESLYYTTTARIRKVWPSRFKSAKAAAPYVKNPEALANKVYGGRLGNTQPGDGWKYRGGGMMQTTGLDGYRRMGFEGTPEALRDPKTAFLTAVREWKNRGLNAKADADDARGVRKGINGGYNGMDHLAIYLPKAKRAFNVVSPSTAKNAPPAPGKKPAAPAYTKEQIEAFQQRLKDLGYHEVGDIDGKWGKWSRGATLTFQADNSLPLSGTMDETTILAMANAPQREIAPARAEATAKDLAPKSETVRRGLRGKIWSAVTALGAGIVAVGQAIVDNVKEAAEYLSPVRDVISEVPGWVWAGGICAVAIAIWRANVGVVNRIVEDYQEGKKP